MPLPLLQPFQLQSLERHDRSLSEFKTKVEEDKVADDKVRKFKALDWSRQSYEVCVKGGGARGVA